MSTQQSGRPDPELFADLSYGLAIISSVIVAVSFIIGLLPIEALRPFGNIVYLALVTSAIGAFLGYAAQSDMRRQRNPDEDMLRRARQGLVINSLYLAALALLTIVLLIISSGIFQAVQV
ncbi:MAG: hypothetical protein GYB68_14700 [Chloroflexi bacterium]|nr:hypothetical protein [Chloroflexota bacterium]